MKDISMRKMANLASDFIGGSGWYDVTFANNGPNDIKIFVTDKDNNVKTYDTKAGANAFIGKDSIKEIKLSIQISNGQSYTFSAQQIGNAVSYSALSGYSLSFSDLMAQYAPVSATPTSASPPTPSPSVGPPAPARTRPSTSPAPAIFTAITHSVGTTLKDSTGNTYLINGPYSFDYTPTGGSKATITTGSKFRAGFGWDQAAAIINKLTSAGATGGAPNAAPPVTGETVAPVAPAAPATEIDSAKVKAGLVILLNAVANGLYKINPGGIKAETKVWKGVIDGFDGADKLADHIISQNQFSDNDRLKIQNIKPGNIPDYNREKFLGTINRIIYTIKNKSKRRFLGIDLRGEEQIAKSVKKKMTAASSLHELHTLSKVAARREKAKKMLNSAVEKENSDK